MRKWFKRSLLFAFALLLAFVPVLSVNASAVEGLSDRFSVSSRGGYDIFPIPDVPFLSEDTSAFAYVVLKNYQTHNVVGACFVVARSGSVLEIETKASDRTINFTADGYLDVYTLTDGNWSYLELPNPFCQTISSQWLATVYTGSNVSIVRDFEFRDVAFSQNCFILSRSTTVPSVFTSVMSWLASLVSGLIVMFYVNGSLTFLGFLAVGGLALGVLLLIFMLISRFMRFGG